MTIDDARQRIKMFGLELRYGIAPTELE